LSPLLFIVSLLVKVTDGGPVLFVQARVGMNGSVFNLYKFRSMSLRDIEVSEKAVAEAVNEYSIKIRNDPRVTRIGQFIRRTSIDELPQLLNVLKGEMSLVGPRPWVPVEYDLFPGDWKAQDRLKTKPGITGLAQIHGRSDLPVLEIISLDRRWASRKSMVLYLQLIFLTALKVLRIGRKEKGVY
jgi:lipopolysaccharide/colanic/teichoic acid biosynthesis glycosyltransferase